MPQVFHRSANSVARASLLASFVIPAAIIWIWAGWDLSPYRTKVDVPRDQPVPFSHKHHVSGLGLDCRYCHTSVEDSGFANIPPIKTCMTCHSQIWTQAAVLQPIRDAWRTDQAVHWNRIHVLPDFVFFNHSIHVAKGIGCETCHGRVDQMPMTQKANALTMGWCLGCHRQPEKYIRPRDQVFTMDYQPPADQIDFGRKLVKAYHIDERRMTDCWVCHR